MRVGSGGFFEADLLGLKRVDFLTGEIARVAWIVPVAGREKIQLVKKGEVGSREVILSKDTSIPTTA